MTRLVAFVMLLIVTSSVTAQSPWRESYQQALAEAKQSGKPLMLDFTAEWCGACKVLDAQAFRNPSVARMLATDFVTVRVDCDQQRALAEKFEVKSLPTLIVVSPDGTIRARRTGSAGAAEIAQWLNPHRGRSSAAPAVTPAPVARTTVAAVDPWLVGHQQLARALAVASGDTPMSTPQSR